MPTAIRGFALTTSVATRIAPDFAKLVRTAKKASDRMEFVSSFRRDSIRTTTVCRTGRDPVERPVNAMVRAHVKFAPWVHLAARLRAQVRSWKLECVMVRAFVCLREWGKTALLTRASTARVKVRVQPVPIAHRDTSVSWVNASRRWVMAQRAAWLRNAHPAIAWTAFVAIRRVPGFAKRVRWPKKAAVSMEFAELSARDRIPTMNARSKPRRPADKRAPAMARARVSCIHKARRAGPAFAKEPWWPDRFAMVPVNASRAPWASIAHLMPARTALAEIPA